MSNVRQQSHDTHAPESLVKVRLPSVQTEFEEFDHGSKGLDRQPSLSVVNLKLSDSPISSQPSWKVETGSPERLKDVSFVETGVNSHDAAVSNFSTIHRKTRERRRPVVNSCPDRTVIPPRSKPQLLRGKSSGLPFRVLQRSQTFDLVKGAVINASRQAIKPLQWANRRRRRSMILQERLNTARKQSHFHDQHFIPFSFLEKLITNDSVDKELARGRLLYLSSRRLRLDTDNHGIRALKTYSDSQVLIRESWRTFRKIFAVLVLIGRPSSIWKFVDEGICDSTLPISAKQIDGGEHHFQCKGDDAYRPLKCFKKWSQTSIVDFLRSQWEVTALHFNGDLDTGEHHVVQLYEVLPFTKWEEVDQTGGFGQVYKAEIEESHHSFPKDLVAVKRLFNKHDDRKRNRDAFMYESGILRSLSKQEHVNKHLIELLSTFERDNQFYLVFPWADTDLEGFWEKYNPEPDLSKWLLEQCAGLSEALYTIHRYRTTEGTTIPYQPSALRKLPAAMVAGSEPLNFFGRHGDIKPNNILFFGQGSSRIQDGILKITDFGIARFTPENIASKRDNDVVPNSPTYRSPECDLPGTEISSQCDIWALGCVYLVFLTWFFGGQGEVLRFAKSRHSRDLYWHGADTDTFFDIYLNENETPRASVKPSVRTKIKDLRIRKDCTKPFQELLDMIEKNMIIVNGKASERLTTPERHHRRMSSGSIRRKMETISQS